jgi:hypothetical protein
VRRLLSTATRFSVVLTRLAYLVWQWQSIIDGEHTAIQPAKILRLHLVRRLWKFKWYRPNFFIRYRLFRSRHDNNKSQRIGKQDRAKSFPLEYRTPPIPQLALPSVATQTTKDKSRLRNLYGEAPDQKYAAESAMRHLGLESIARRLTGKLASGFVRTALREKGKPFRRRHGRQGRRQSEPRRVVCTQAPFPSGLHGVGVSMDRDRGRRPGRRC